MKTKTIKTILSGILAVIMISGWLIPAEAYTDGPKQVLLRTEEKGTIDDGWVWPMIISSNWVLYDIKTPWGENDYEVTINKGQVRQYDNGTDKFTVETSSTLVDADPSKSIVSVRVCYLPIPDIDLS
ncbi:MAG: hypothetical protein KAQ99_10320, partial [Candidatus Aureabacteria bacterium]|nr:hypothetical protein [Candidatus Auribacterota bacterium]